MNRENANIQLWEDYASVYDSLNSFYPYSMLIKQVADKVKSLASCTGKDSAAIIDAGCGTGNLILRMIETEGFCFTGIDKSIAMLDIASAKFSGYTGKVSFVNGDIEDDFFWSSFIDQKGENSITAVIFNLVLFNVSDKNRLYKNIHKLLKPGGYMIAVDFKNGWRKFNLIKSHLAHRGIISLVKNAAATYRIESITKKIFSNFEEPYLEEDDHKHLLIEAGFDLISIEKVYADQAYLITGRKKILL